MTAQAAHVATQALRDDQDRRLHGRGLVVARLAAIAVTLLAVPYFVTSLPYVFDRFQQRCTDLQCPLPALTPARLHDLEQAGLSTGFFAGWLVALGVLFAGVSFVVGGIIFWRRSDDRLALVVALALVAFGGIFFSGDNDVLAAQSSVWRGVVGVLRFLGNTGMLLCFYLFPDGRFVPRWTRVLAGAFILLAIPIYLVRVVPLSQWLDPAVPVLTVGLLVAAVVVQVYRYLRVSTRPQRQQTKWVVLGLTVANTSYVAGSLVVPSLAATPSALVVLLVYTILTLGVLCMPLSIGIAILRYRLWDIDLLINRTLVYGALTASVVAIYVFVVGYLGALFRTSGNLLISLVATGIVAVVFQPLRDRLQRGVNRVLYGARDEPYDVLAHLGQRLDSTREPDAVLTTIVETVRDALKLPYVAIILDHDGAATRAAAGTPVADPLSLPISYQGAPIGQLILGPRSPGEAFSIADRRLVDVLARQAGVAAHAVRLTADLQRSRERLVLAREEERRRLRNDLHDGLGPQLAGLTLKLQTAHLRLAHDPLADTLLTELIGRTQAAVVDIRRVVYDLRPPSLDELGLLSALREGAAQLDAQEPGGIHIHIDTPDSLPPLPAAIEVATYRIAQEALTNVITHAHARVCTLRLAVDEPASMLLLEVQDDGHGIAPDHRIGVGLVSMRERTTELGGTLTIEQVATGGTRVRALLPLKS